MHFHLGPTRQSSHRTTYDTFLRLTRGRSLCLGQQLPESTASIRPYLYSRNGPTHKFLLHTGPEENRPLREALQLEPNGPRESLVVKVWSLAWALVGRPRRRQS